MKNYPKLYGFVFGVGNLCENISEMFNAMTNETQKEASDRNSLNISTESV